MGWLETTSSAALPQTIINWLLSGVLVGLGMIVPGMSPSNFLIYIGLYLPIARGISRLDWQVLFYLVLGWIGAIAVFAKLIAWLFTRFYATMCHLIVGVVLDSTLTIIPMDGTGLKLAASAVLFAAGNALSYRLARLNEQKPHEPVG